MCSHRVSTDLFFLLKTSLVEQPPLLESVSRRAPRPSSPYLLPPCLAPQAPRFTAPLSLVNTSRCRLVSVASSSVHTHSSIPRKISVCLLHLILFYLGTVENSLFSAPLHPPLRSSALPLRLAVSDKRTACTERPAEIAQPGPRFSLPLQ